MNSEDTKYMDNIPGVLCICSLHLFYILAVHFTTVAIFFNASVSCSAAWWLANAGVLLSI